MIMERKQPEILDLDIFLPPPRVIRLTERDDPGGFPGFVRRILRILGVQFRGQARKIDLSLVTTRTTLMIEQHFKDFLAAVQEDDISAIEDCMYDLMVAACKPSFSEITRAWIERNTVPDQVLKMFEFILQPLRDRAEKNAADLAKLGKATAAR